MPLAPFRPVSPKGEREVSLSWLASPALLEAIRLTLTFGTDDSARTWLIYFNTRFFHKRAFFSSGIYLPTSITESVRKRQAEFFFGRAAARLGLESLGVDVSNIPVGPSGAPIWPDGIIGSITHSSGAAAAAVSHRGLVAGIGIDIEKVIDAETAGAIVGSVVNADEMVRMNESHSGVSLEVLLTIAFSAKESLFKGAYGEVASFFDFDAAHIRRFDIEHECIHLAMTETLSATFVRGREFVVHFCFLASNRIMTYFAY